MSELDELIEHAHRYAKAPMTIEFICDKCGEAQKRDESASTDNWDVMPVVPCKCGGKFVPTVVAPKRKRSK